MIKMPDFELSDYDLKKALGIEDLTDEAIINILKLDKETMNTQFRRIVLKEALRRRNETLNRNRDLYSNSRFNKKIDDL